ncbi:tyrosine-type recombinase/integrase [Microbacterium sp. NPDC056569]|uniref:tyrosine-type recombinase/integrase n=1 Tax=Microbacterium sp. NPDC056569 TaxID=3345867 RepID=UPI00366CA631
MTQKTRRAPGAWGTAEQLPSGRWRAFYRRDGAKFGAPHTFATKADAQAWLAGEHSDRSRGTWHDPRSGRVTVADYSATWLDSRPDLSPRTANNYRELLRRWILPRVGGARGVELGAFALGDLSPAVIRTWYASLFAATRENAERVRAREHERSAHPARLWAKARGLAVADSGRMSPAVLEQWRRAGSPLPAPTRGGAATEIPQAAGRSTAAHAYSVLRTMLNTAVQDGLIATSPCQLAGAGTQRPRERRPASPEEVAQLAAVMPAEFAAAVTLAAWSSLRHGELFALARRHVDLEARTVRVERALLALPGHPVEFAPPKTAKSRRTVHLPAFVVDTLRAHIDAHVSASPDALLFTMPDGHSPVTTFRTSALLKKARAVIDRPDLTWHDLRHTGATLAYRTGASVPEVQARLGHTTMRAALIYAHAADDSDRVLADRLDEMFAASAAPARRLKAL